MKKLSGRNAATKDISRKLPMPYQASPHSPNRIHTRYWDWSKYASDPANSPIFDGSATSLSGQGAYIPHEAWFYRIPRTGEINLNITIPAGPGGGCVQGGPFANHTVNLGPVNSAGSLPGWIGDGSGLDYNPRCLTRDINSYWSLKDLNYAKVQSAIVDTADFAAFAQRFANPGLHPAGHFTIGGMNSDLWDSPADPAFYLHHAQVDRVWTLWQGRNLARRETELMGTTTWFNSKFSLFPLSLLPSCLPTYVRDLWLVFCH